MNRLVHAIAGEVRREVVVVRARPNQTSIVPRRKVASPVRIGCATAMVARLVACPDGLAVVIQDEVAIRLEYSLIPVRAVVNHPLLKLESCLEPKRLPGRRSARRDCIGAPNGRVSDHGRHALIVNGERDGQIQTT